MHSQQSFQQSESNARSNKVSGRDYHAAYGVRNIQIFPLRSTAILRRNCSIVRRGKMINSVRIGRTSLRCPYILTLASDIRHLGRCTLRSIKKNQILNYNNNNNWFIDSINTKKNQIKSIWQLDLQAYSLSWICVCVCVWIVITGW